MFEVKNCETCRFNPYGQNDPAGQDCMECNDFDRWMKIKEIIPDKCRICFYKDDPCHYLCMNCENGSNFTPVKKELEEVIREKELELDSLKKQLQELK